MWMFEFRLRQWLKSVVPDRDEPTTKMGEWVRFT
jgi:hypothetical protein